MSLDDFNHMQYDVFKEIGNIGAGNATTALSKMINTKIEMEVPRVSLLEFSELADALGSAEDNVVGILVTLDGDIDGMMMFILNIEGAKSLLDLLIGESPSFEVSKERDEFSSMELSALKEVGNIISGAYLSSLSTLTDMTITASIPYIAIDMAGAILSVPAIEFGKIGDGALLIETEFGNKIQAVNGFFILIPTLDSYEAILASLGL